MAKRRLPQTSARSKRTKVAAATNNVASTPEASPEPASKPASKPRPQRRSPRKTLAAASQANASPPIPTFELQFLESQAEAEIVAPTEGSRAGTVATTEAGEGGQDETNSALVENFDGIDWARLPDFIKPLARSKRPKSWIFQYGYRVVERHATSRIWFVCKYCHVHKTIDAGRGGLFNITQATTSAATHLSQPKPGHNLTKDGPKLAQRARGQLSLRQAFDAGLDVQQNTANAFGNFDVEGFRTATVMWLVNRNHPLSELTTPDFREMMRFANPEAEAALWVSNTSVSTFVMRLFRSIRPQVIDTLSGSVSKIHVSFDGWTTKGGKRGFFGVVAHFADAAGIIRDLPIDLPELAGAHTGEAIAKAISTTLSAYGITSDRLGYFVLDNATNNDTAIAALAREYEFESAHRRLRCSCHTLNLIGQAIIFGTNKDAYGNTQEQYNTEEQYMREWRKDGPIGVLVDVINYIKTPQQYELFRGYQRLANNNLPAEGRLKVLEPVKPVVTRWNSYYAAFERATKLQAAYNLYAEHHINRVILEDAHAAQRNNKRPDAPNWMRSTGLRAADWAVIAEYQDCLEPLKYATKRLEGRSKDGKYGAIYEVIPVFEYVLSKLEARARPFEHVDFNAHAEAPEDHLNVNLRAAWSKANDYYNKLDDSPAYYAAVCLHPYYKNYCDVAWADKADWLTSANASFQQLWAAYKPQRARQRYTTAPSSNNIDEAIIAILSRNNDREAPLDEFERWKTQEPQWTQEQYNADGNPVQYWIQLLPKYPHLAQFAIDIMTIPASSSDCERLFSELGDLLEPKRRALGSELLAALQLVRSWVRAGYKPYNCSEAKLSDEQLSDYHDIHTEDDNNFTWKYLQGCADAAWLKCVEYYNNQQLNWQNRFPEDTDLPPAYYAAQILDPYRKWGWFRQEWVLHGDEEKKRWFENAQLAVKHLWETEYKGRYPVEMLPPPARKERDPDPAFDRQREHKRIRIDAPVSTTDLYEQYISTDRLHNEEAGCNEAIAYWLSRYDSQRDLARFALDMFAISPMSDECERLFSSAKLTIVDRRGRLKADIIEACECLRAWYGKPQAERNSDRLRNNQFNPVTLLDPLTYLGRA
ncbi:Dimer-Tnp-hAT dimerization containing protein [Pyrenophora tritici-repentis]|nr:Dimer-Tnp-hAT dimerization containing protein [Pyrenophora tritici-repentis]